jgi:hypothetical protein
MASTDATLRAFFQAPKYAVVGASTNTEKYGYKGTVQMPLSLIHQGCWVAGPIETLAMSSFPHDLCFSS